MIIDYIKNNDVDENYFDAYTLDAYFNDRIIAKTNLYVYKEEKDKAFLLAIVIEEEYEDEIDFDDFIYELYGNLLNNGIKELFFNNEFYREIKYPGAIFVLEDEEMEIYKINLKNAVKNRQIERIKTMEKYLDDLLETKDSLENALNLFEKNISNLNKLETYYNSEKWLFDLDSDQNNKLPDNLKRGILSEDAIYNTLTDIDDLIERMQDIIDN